LYEDLNTHQIQCFKNKFIVINKENYNLLKESFNFEKISLSKTFENFDMMNSINNNDNIIDCSNNNNNNNNESEVNLQENDKNISFSFVTNKDFSYIQSIDAIELNLNNYS
jgi:hypothetical protein